MEAFVTYMVAQTVLNGKCRFGGAKCDLTPERTLPMAGFSLSGQRGQPGTDRLWARCFYLEDLQTGDPVIWVFLDLMGASLALHQAVAHELTHSDSPGLAQRFVLTGTHTHTAPGKFYGSSFYDRFASTGLLEGFDQVLTEGWARLIAQAILTAKNEAEPAELWLVENEVWGASYNRSIEAWRRNKLPLNGPAALSETQRAVNPLLTALVFLRASTKQHLATASFFACHGTSLGRKYEYYDRDWFGVAVDQVEDSHQGMVAIGGGTSGDVSPQIVVNGAALPHGPALRDEVGARVGQKLAESIKYAVEKSQSTPGELPILPITLHSGLFEVTERDQWPRFQLGVPMLKGSEDGGPSYGPFKFFAKMVGEGYTEDGGPQAPKAPALGGLQGTLLALLRLDLARAHPWHRIGLGSHLFCTMPGEPTGPAGDFLSQQLVERLEISGATIVGYSGDYAGYFTTPEEYSAQHYEGASTLYGQSSLALFVDQVTGPERNIPLRIDNHETLAEARSDLPCRQLQVLLQEAIEHPEGAGDRRVVFAVPQLPLDGPLPAVRISFANGDVHEAIVRRFPHPDRAGAPQLSVFIAIVRDALDWGEPEQLTVNGEAPRPITLAAAASERFTSPLGRVVRFPPRQLQPWFLLSALLSVLAFFFGLFAPEFVLGLLGQAATDLRVFALRIVALTPLLLAVEHYAARATPDALAALYHGAAAWLFWAGVLVAALLLGPGWPVIVFAALGMLLTKMVMIKAVRVYREQAEQRRERWEFWWPLYSVSWLTLVLGAVFIIFAPWWVIVLSKMQLPDPSAAILVALFGLGLLTNSVAMMPSSMSRDRRVIAGQLLGSLAYDLLAPALIILAVSIGVLQLWVLAMVSIFLLIDVWFLAVYRRVRHQQDWVIERPPSVLEVARHIRAAVSDFKVARVMGSGHSVGPAIFADGPPAPPPLRKSEATGVHMSFERLDRVVSVDTERKLITVQAGMHIGTSPNQPRSPDNHLLQHLAHLGWSLPNLGGVAHQSVGGFLATGCDGGSLRYSFNDAVTEMRFIDGQGRTHVVDRNTPDGLLAALEVSLGLFGQVVEVTFACDMSYTLAGREVTAEVSPAGMLRIPNRNDSSMRELDLKQSGEFEAFLRESDYHRIMWWPQKGVNKMAIWEANRTIQALPVIPYEAPPWIMQWGAGLLLRLVGLSFGNGLLRFVGQAFFPLMAPAIEQFLPQPSVSFRDRWDKILPMDHNTDDHLLPTQFTEMWFPLEAAHEVLTVLLDMYQSEAAAGTYACELYTARASTAWLSPAQGADVLRVDLFWFKRNRGDPVYDYFPQFWTRLAAIAFRCHWGKYLPPPGCAQGAAYLAAQYPLLPAFKHLRRHYDPKNVFLSRYWRNHLQL